MHLFVHEDGAEEQGEAQHQRHARHVLGLLLPQRPPSRRRRGSPCLAIVALLMNKQDTHNDFL